MIYLPYSEMKTHGGSEEDVLMLVNRARCNTVRARENIHCVPSLGTLTCRQFGGRFQELWPSPANSSGKEWGHPYRGLGEGSLGTVRARQHGWSRPTAGGPGACQDPRLLRDVHPLALLDHMALIWPWNVLLCLLVRSLHPCWATD